MCYKQTFVRLLNLWHRVKPESKFTKGSGKDDQRKNHLSLTQNLDQINHTVEVG